MIEDFFFVRLSNIFNFMSNNLIISFLLDVIVMEFERDIFLIFVRDCVSLLICFLKGIIKRKEFVYFLYEFF